MSPSTNTGLLAVLASGMALPLTQSTAQVIRGRVSLPDSSNVSNVSVSAIARDGTREAASITSANGLYILRLPRPGDYEVRATRIGFRSNTSGLLTLRIGDTVNLNILLRVEPVTISGLSTISDSECGLKGKDAASFVELWQRSVAALVSVSRNRLEEAGTIVVRRNGRVDAVDYNSPAEAGDPAVTWDIERTREWFSDQLLAQTRVVTLLDSGYVRPRGNGAYLYDVPNAEALLHDSFLEAHCFGVVAGVSARHDMVGLTFRPKRVLEGISDIKGTLWLDRRSAELRVADFTYTNVPPAEYTMCEKDFPQDPATRECRVFRETGQNRIGAGGEISFARTPLGWITSSTVVRTPSDEWSLRESKRKVRHLRGDSCTDRAVPRQMRRAGDCVYLLMPVPRLDVTVTRISRIVLGAAAAYQDSLAGAWIAEASTRRAGKRPSGLSGTVTSMAGDTVQSAILQLEGLGRVTLSDQVGAFVVPVLPPGRTRVTVVCTGRVVGRFEFSLLPDSSHGVRISLPIESKKTGRVQCL